MCSRALSFLALAASLHAESLEDVIRARIAGFPGTVTLCARNLDSGAVVGIQPTDPVRTASTIKLPIMAAVFDTVSRGKAAWTDLLTVTPQEKVSGSGVIG